LRANAFLLGPSGTQIIAQVTFSGPTLVDLTNPVQTVAFIQPGLTVGASPIPNYAARITEGFAGAFKDRNVAFTAGNIAAAVPGNATYTPPWTFNSPASAYYPPQLAQNVPGVQYNTEDMFQWQPQVALPYVNGPNASNPPVGFGAGPVVNLGNYLLSYYTSTGIGKDGVSTQGTRIALRFSGLPSGVTVKCHTAVALVPQVASPPVASGILFMTPTNTAGSGAYPASAPLTGLWNSSNTNLVVYEVLYADPFRLEFADIPCAVFGPNNSNPGPTPVQVRAMLAPFYNSPIAGIPTPTAANPLPVDLPRFGEPGGEAGPPPILVTLPGAPVGTLVP
jgi:hypothetical protein